MNRHNGVDETIQCRFFSPFTTIAGEKLPHVPKTSLPIVRSLWKCGNCASHLVARESHTVRCVKENGAREHITGIFQLTRFFSIFHTVLTQSGHPVSPELLQERIVHEMLKNIEQLLGAEAKNLLGHVCKGI